MRITHLCLGCFFPDGYTYQENMLPKYHKQLGHDVSVVASLQTFDEDGNVSYLEKACEYRNEYDIPVRRLDYKKPLKFYRKMKRFVGTYEAVEETKPDVLFIHGCQFLDMDVIVRYAKKHPSVKIFVDNHADFSNSARGWFSLNILHKIVWRHCARIIEPYTSKFFGVLPARVDFLKNIYHIPENKTELLVMGSEDDKVEASLEPGRKAESRKNFGLTENDFVIVFGGKVDKAKTQVLLLMDAVNSINDSSVKLAVFGSIIPEMKDILMSKCGERVQYIGWATPQQSYDYFSMADIVCFPGRHSVYWEQVAGMGIPLIVRKWEGTTHIDVGGNAVFLTEDSAEEIQRSILEVKDHYEEYKTRAMNGRKQFMYSTIAERSLQD